MSDFRTEHDSMGDILVEEKRLWGAQTQRSLENFRIGTEKMPPEVIRALIQIKLAAARANSALGKLSTEKLSLIECSCEELLSGGYDDEFPLKVWQTGSGTQTNMNVNEVISRMCLLHSGGKLSVHPNDDVNMSQSSNDVFPSAMHVAALSVIGEKLLPSLDALAGEFGRLEEENTGIIKTGRTHLQDAVPITFSQEISGWRASLLKDREMISRSSEALLELAIGGTAVGTALNCPEGFSDICVGCLNEITSGNFMSSGNRFHALSSKGELAAVHGTLRALAADLMKIANDIRWLASGPRCGLGEITIPENEPGSSIMPGKVNPTQCEAVCMAAVQVMGNDAAVGIAASQGNFELNVYMPVIIYDFLQSARLLSDVMDSFRTNCVSGIRAVPEKMEYYLSRSLMTVTALSPAVGYENACSFARRALEENITLKRAALDSGLVSEEEYDRLTDPENMV